MKVEINIYNDCSFKYLPKKKVINSLKNVFKYENLRSNVFVNIIYITDKEILKINRKYLKHNSTTDVITFFLGDEKNTLEGEIYISIDTAIKQAKQYKVSLTNEIKRLAVHGALHLIGYDDNTIDKREIMHNLENKYI
jgi:rRNA maturation RNase YbeY